MAMTAGSIMRRLKYWGWGYEGDGLDAGAKQALLATFAEGYDICPNRDGGFPAPQTLDLLGQDRFIPFVVEEVTFGQLSS